MKKFFIRIKLFLQMKFGKSNEFIFVRESEGEPVGPELKVAHLTYHDMANCACRCRLAEEIILKIIEANAIRVISFERLDERHGVTTFQPCKI